MLNANKVSQMKELILKIKDADKAYVEYVLQDYNKPMGVATYKIRQQQLKELLPDEEKLKNML